MKILLVVVGLFVAAAAGAAGATLFAPASTATQAPLVEPARAAPSAPAASREVDERVQALSMEVADLQAQIRELRAASQRTAVVEPEAAPKIAASAPVTAVQRDQILRVIADQKADEERQREEERKKREDAQNLQRADRMAERFGLNEAQERQLADFYGVSRVKFDEMRETMRLAGESGSFDGEQMRAAMRDARDWANTELERMFGPDVGKQIAEAEQDRMRGGFGGNFGGGEGGRGGRRGGNANNGAGAGNGNGGNGPGGQSGG